MVFQLVQSAYVGASQTTANSVTLTNPVAPGNLIVGAVGYFCNNGVITLPANSITDNKGNTYVQQASCFFNSTPTNWAYNMFYLTNVPSRPIALTCALSGGNAGGIYVAEFTPSGFFDKYSGLNGNVNQLTATGIINTNSIAIPQANTLVVAVEASPGSQAPSNINPQSGGNWITIVRDVTSDPNLNPSGIGPDAIFQYQIVTTPMSIQGTGTGFGTGGFPSFTAAMIIDFCPASVSIVPGQICVG